MNFKSLITPLYRGSDKPGISILHTPACDCSRVCFNSCFAVKLQKSFVDYDTSPDFQHAHVVLVSRVCFALGPTCLIILTVSIHTSIKRPQIFVPVCWFTFWSFTTNSRPALSSYWDWRRWSVALNNGSQVLSADEELHTWAMTPFFIAFLKHRPQSDSTVYSLLHARL